MGIQELSENSQFGVGWGVGAFSQALSEGRPMFSDFKTPDLEYCTLRNTESD